jgi:hypothetical protein
MSRLRGNLPTYLQRWFGISRRTFERWCVRGDVPGAYRTRGGHWRVRKPARATVKSVLFRGAQTRRDQVWLAIIDYPFNPSNSYPSARDIARDRAAIKLTLAAKGITEEDVRDNNLDERDPEKYRFLWEKSPPTLHPLAVKATNDPLFALRFAAYEMRLNGRKVTRAALERALDVSVATLYRRHGQSAVRAVCEEPPLRVLPSVGKKTPIRARSELD